MTIPIIYKDKNLIVINKPTGLLVHGLTSDDEQITLISWLAEHYPEIGEYKWPEPSRPGIVHRLDRDTSGVMIIAKNPTSLAALQAQFHDRLVQKQYRALVAGAPAWSEHTIQAPVARSQGTKRRAQYLKLNDQAKDAETTFQTLARFKVNKSDVADLEAEPKTGRTHQIRVHLGLLGYPILGDPWYRTKLSRNLAETLNVPRLMLHAAELNITNPETGESQKFSADLPNDYQEVLNKLK